MIIFSTLLLLTSGLVGAYGCNTEDHSVIGTSQSSKSCSNDSLCDDVIDCPPGFICVQGNCQCRETYPQSIIKCNHQGSFVLRRFCVTFNNFTKLTVLGDCLRAKLNDSKSKNSLYSQLPREVQELDEKFCQPLGRTGDLCGKCLPDHYPLAYTFNASCISCPHANWNWAKYIAAAYLPLTAFFFFILLFKPNTTSSQFFAVVFLSQAVTFPIIVRIIHHIITEELDLWYIKAVKALFSVYGIWNLEFCRPFYDGFCLRTGILPTLVLDYAIAVYPLLLTFVSFLLMRLYSKNYRVVTTIWRPFRFLFRKNWDSRTSLIDSYSTFFFISSMKILNLSLTLLTPARVYYLHQNSTTYSNTFYYAGHIKFFGKEHLPYAILAITMLCIFVILPIAVLSLYPFQRFQKLLSLLPAQWCIFLNIFIDSFQGCYKDGTEPGTHDYRWFVSIFFIIRMLQFLSFSVNDVYISGILVVILSMILSTLIMILQPFKSQVSNIINIVFMNILTLFAFMLVAITSLHHLAPQFSSLVYILFAMFGVIPILYVIGVTSYWLHSHKVGRGLLYIILRRKSTAMDSD